MIYKVRLLKSRIKTHLILDEIITSSKEVFRDGESHMVVKIGLLGNPTGKIAGSNVIL